MKYLSALGCTFTLIAALTASSPVSAAVYSGSLDLTDAIYPATVNGMQGNFALDLVRFDLGSGWNGQMNIELTTGSYFDLTTTLGFALTTDANDTLYNDPTPFLALTDTSTNVTEFFNDNVNGWQFYSWGSDYINSGGTSNLTEAFAPMIFDPDEHYYAFVAGGSVLPTEIGVDLNVSAVPVPAAVWLFGSGLLGLVGLNRRKQANA
ncbi:MAG: VPLPA-CTERM sorting domain-containing protein [Candidatus Thiodiazotropha sp.]